LIPALAARAGTPSARPAPPATAGITARAAATTGERGKQMVGKITRTYESFRIDWDGGPAAGGASWSGYQTAEEAQAAIDKGRRPGDVIRKTFQVTFAADKAHLYRPGIADKAAATAIGR
jgi:hypothetical protein